MPEYTPVTWVCQISTTAPTTVIATINPATFNKEQATQKLAQQLGIPESAIAINAINSTAVSITFTGSDAAQKVTEVTNFNSTSLNNMGVNSVQAAPGEPVTEAPSSPSKIGMLAGIAVGAVLLLVGIAYLVARKRGSSGSTGAQKFDMGYDEESFFSQYEQQMEPQGGNNPTL